MQNKRRWLPAGSESSSCSLSRAGIARRQAAQWRRARVSTAQHWVDRYRGGAAADQVSGAGRMISPARHITSPAWGYRTASTQKLCRSRRRGLAVV